jgi:hypothetical protein
MTFDPLTAAFDLGKIAIEKLFPDPTKRAEEMRKLEEMRQNGDLAKLNAHVQLMLKQADINLADAKSGKLFQSGWRPAIGWVGALSLGLMYIPKALVMTGIWTWQCYSALHGSVNASDIVLPMFPDLGVTDIIGLLMSMLGVAAMRSYDKKIGTDTK